VGSDASGIKYSEAVEACLAPSRSAAAFLGLACAATLILIALTLSGVLARWAAAACVTLAAFDALHVDALRRGPRGVRCLRVDRSKAIEVADAAGRRRFGALRDGSFVAPWLTIVRWRPAGARFDRTFVILPDMLDAKTFRELRVLLRWA
jgi:toxin CptA